MWIKAWIRLYSTRYEDGANSSHTVTWMWTRDIHLYIVWLIGQIIMFKILTLMEERKEANQNREYGTEESQPGMKT